MKRGKLIVLVILIVGLLGGQFLAEAPAESTVVETPSVEVTAAPVPAPVPAPVSDPVPSTSPDPAPASSAATAPVTESTPAPTPSTESTPVATTPEPTVATTDPTSLEPGTTPGETNPTMSETDPTSPPSTESEPTNSTPSPSSENKDYTNAFGLLQDKDKKRNYLEIEQGADFDFKVVLFNLADEPLKVEKVLLGAYKDPKNSNAEPEKLYISSVPADRPKPWELKPGKDVEPAKSSTDPENGLSLDFGKFKLADDAPSPNYVGVTVTYVDKNNKGYTQYLRYSLVAKTPDATEPSEEPTNPTDPTNPTEPTQPGQKFGLELTFPASDGLYRPNERRDLSFALTNTGDLKLEITRLELLSNGQWPFGNPTGPSGVNTQLAIEAGKTAEVDLFEVQTLAEIAPGSYPLELNVSYHTSTGVSGDKAFPINIVIINSDNPTEPTETNITEPTESTTTESTETTTTTTTEPVGSTTTEPTQPTEPGTTTQPTEPEETTTTEPTDFSGGDWGGGGGDWGGGGYVGGGTGETIPNPKARLLMEGFETTPKEVKAGEAFKLKIKLRNTSTDVFLRNLKFTLSSDGNSFLPVTGSSTIFLSRIEIDSTAEIEIDFLPQANLEQRPYALTMEMVYEDQKGTELSGSETLAIPIYQEARAEIGRMEVMPQEVTVGNQVNLMFSVINKGKNKLYNVTVQAATEEQSLEIPQTFVGNIEAGTQTQVDLMATAKSPLYEPQELVVTYEDELGNVSELKSSVDKLVINEMMEEPMGEMFDPEEMPETEEPERGGLETWHYAAIAGGGVVLLGATAGIVRRHRRKKRAAMDLGLDDEL